jgi:hypothetical protein
MHSVSRTMYALPASILSDEPTHEQDPSSLRAEASTDGVAYVQVVRSLFDGTTLVRVAAHPEQLFHQGYMLVLDDADLQGARAFGVTASTEAILVG